MELYLNSIIIGNSNIMCIGYIKWYMYKSWMVITVIIDCFMVNFLIA
jgi:hypothetical protein